MKTIAKKLENKPSAALRAMRDGLLNASKLPNFIVHMGTFGTLNDDICYGCAATCAVDKITNGANIKSLLKTGNTLAYSDRYSEKYRDDLDTFESVMDAARRGDTEPLFEYMGVRDEWKPTYDNRFSLSSSGWKEELPDVTKLAKKLAAKGL